MLNWCECSLWYKLGVEYSIRWLFCVQRLYHQYSEGKEFEHGRQEDRDAQTEFNRQRDHLERTVSSLKKLYYKETSKENTSDKIMKVRHMSFHPQNITFVYYSLVCTGLLQYGQHFIGWGVHALDQDLQKYLLISRQGNAVFPNTRRAPGGANFRGGKFWRNHISVCSMKVF